MIINFKGRMILDKNVSSIDSVDLDLLAHRVNKAWDARPVNTLIGDEDVALDVSKIEIEIYEDNNVVYYEINVYYNGILDLEQQNIIRNDLAFEVDDLNEFIMGFKEFNGITFDGQSMLMLLA